MNETWIVDAVRTPFGKFGKVFQNVSGVELGRIVVDYMLRNHEIDKEEVNEVIMGNVIGAGLGQNPARQIALKSGLPSKVGAFTVNKVCGSGLKSIILGTQAIKTGDVDVVIAGGIENMSQAPHLINGYRLQHPDCIGTSHSSNIKNLNEFDIRNSDIKTLNLEKKDHKAVIIASFKSSIFTF